VVIKKSFNHHTILITKLLVTKNFWSHYVWWSKPISIAICKLTECFQFPIVWHSKPFSNH
jgi:hypothetical protein